MLAIMFNKTLSNVRIVTLRLFILRSDGVFSLTLLFLRRLFVNGQFKKKGSTFVQFAFSPYPAAMFGDNPQANTQAKPRTFAYFLGSFANNIRRPFLEDRLILTFVKVVA